jgi:hypothetical protein
MQTRFLTLLALAGVGMAMMLLMMGWIQMSLIVLGFVAAGCLAIAIFNWRMG